MRMQSSQWLQALASSLSSYRSSEAELVGTRTTGHAVPRGGGLPDFQF